jgi:hypothetical protein
LTTVHSTRRRRHFGQLLEDFAVLLKMISFRKKVNLSTLFVDCLYQYFECASFVREGMNNTMSLNEKPGMELFLFGSRVFVLINIIIITLHQPLEIGIK